MANSFTDHSPSFPYESGEARSRLGIPDSPEVHLAITALADELLEKVQGLPGDTDHKRISALHVASAAVLLGHPRERAELEIFERFSVPIGEGEWQAVCRVAPVDWLRLAAEQLEREGVVVDARFRDQATRYGWSVPRQSSRRVRSST